MKRWILILIVALLATASGGATAQAARVDKVSVLVHPWGVFPILLTWERALELNYVDVSVSGEGRYTHFGVAEGVEKPRRLWLNRWAEFRSLRWRHWGSDRAIAVGSMRYPGDGRPSKRVYLNLQGPSIITCRRALHFGKKVQLLLYTSYGWAKGFRAVRTDYTGTEWLERGQWYSLPGPDYVETTASQYLCE